MISSPPPLLTIANLIFLKPLFLLGLLVLPIAWLLMRKSALRSFWAPWLRTAALAFLVFSLAEPAFVSHSSASSTVFVVDRSQSIDGTSASNAEAWIASAIDQANSSDQISIITFGANPDLAISGQTPGNVGQEWSNGEGIDGEATNIESALAIARALPGGGSKRIVLVSDGAENVGSAIDQAIQSASDIQPINVLPLPSVSDDDLRVTGLTAPSAVWNQEPVTVVTSIASGTAGTGQVQFLVDGVVTKTEDATFSPGLNSYSFGVDDLSPGYHEFTVQVIPDSGDRIAENNSAVGGVVVRDAPSVLVVTSTGESEPAVADSLTKSGVHVTVVTPAEIPARTSDLAQFDSIILDNLPADQLTIDQMAAFQEVVKSKGRGLIVIGGSNSYGRGGYAGTPLEEMLPVDVKVTEGKERQKVAILIIVDTSGSMVFDQHTGVAKIDLARDAVKLAANVLVNGDEFGILAFNSQQTWVLPMTQVEGAADRDTINAAADTLEAEGSTEIYPALQVGFDAMAQSDATVRHVILLSDGKSESGTRDSYKQLIEKARGNRITFSAIAIGEDADFDLLQFLAQEGNGRYHYASSPDDIPKLTLQEAQSAGSQSIIRYQFQPIQANTSGIMSNLNVDKMPMIDGYNYTESKNDGQVVLTSDRGDPLLSTWQYGLGRVVAWTADDGIDFASAWPGWSGYDEFWQSVVGWSLPDPEADQLQVSTVRTAGGVSLSVSSIDQDGHYVDLSGAKATLSSASGEPTDLTLVQASPGEYVAQLPDTDAADSYHLVIANGNNSPLLDSVVTLPQSAELQADPNASQLMANIAQVTGGQILSLEDPGQVFTLPTASGSAIPNYRQFWWLPLTLGLLVFLTELSLRYDLRGKLAALANLKRS